RRVNIHRNNSPVSKGPYTDTYHNLDMYFEFLLWDMDGSDIIMSKALAGSFGQAEFQSESYFTQGIYNKLQGIDEYHPLVRLKNFAEWYYSETFPIDEFAKWLNKPLDLVTGLCLELANKGFILYNKASNTVTLKKKVYDYVAAFLKQQDYDAIDIISEVDATTNNAILNLSNKLLTINGISKFNVSTAQNVTIIPYESQIKVGKNRTINFDGIVEAGLFTIYGHDFSFDYDTFKIRLNTIDSLYLAVETGNHDEYGNSIIEDIHNVIQLGTADLYIDKPNNKSGLLNYEEYPIFESKAYSYIFYDKLKGIEGKYPKDKVYFRIDPFSYENTDHYTYDDISFYGEFHADGILEPTNQHLIYQDNGTLGFNMTVPKEGLPVYDGAGQLYENLSMTNSGLIGSGTLTHLSSTITSDSFKFFPDSMSAIAQSFVTEEDPQNRYPAITAQDVSVTWLTDNDLFEVSNKKGKPFSMYDNGTTLDGKLALSSSKTYGEGNMSLTDARISSNGFSFTSSTITADSSSYNLMSPTNNGYAFIANDANTMVDFKNKTTSFHLNSDTSMVMFPVVQYICTMTDFTYDMETKIMDMEQKGKRGSELMSPDELLRLTPDRYDKPTFMATNIIKDTISFTSWKGRYHVEDEYIEAESINYIPIADALIQPDSGKIIINKHATIETMKNAIVAINNNHLIHSASINI
ncbi:MAG: hypothetical protein J6T30_02575, partial [Bacteroidales bacterium]|nr:hypothetical protein [Bacteroidales bacterium]